MKLVKTASGKKTIKVSKKEWQSIGKTAGWMKKASPMDATAQYYILTGNGMGNYNAGTFDGLAPTWGPFAYEKAVKMVDKLHARGTSEATMATVEEVRDTFPYQDLPESYPAPEEVERDLFETPELLPENIQGILDKYNDRFEDGEEGYMLCKELIVELEQNGYTADYGLDAAPYGLKKL